MTSYASSFCILLIPPDYFLSLLSIMIPDFSRSQLLYEHFAPRLQHRIIDQPPLVGCVKTPAAEHETTTESIPELTFTTGRSDCSPVSPASYHNLSPLDLLR